MRTSSSQVWLLLLARWLASASPTVRPEIHVPGHGRLGIEHVSLWLRREGKCLQPVAHERKPVTYRSSADTTAPDVRYVRDVVRERPRGGRGVQGAQRCGARWQREPVRRGVGARAEGWQEQLTVAAYRRRSSYNSDDEVIRRCRLGCSIISFFAWFDKPESAVRCHTAPSGDEAELKLALQRPELARV